MSLIEGGYPRLGVNLLRTDFSRAKIKSLLKERGIRLTKRYGQNFLLDKNVLAKIVDAADIEGADHIFEIGGGLGHLTGAILSKKDVRITVFEIDKKLCSFLKEKFSFNDNVKIVCRDFLTIDFKDYVLEAERVVILSNIPYNITSPIIEKCFTNHSFIASIFFTVQKDFALRVISSPSTKNYGSISVFCQSYSRPSILFSISQNVFFPMPKIESCLLHFDLSISSRDEIKDDILFRNVLRSIFSKRRKNIFNALRMSEFISLTEGEILKGLSICDISPSIRGESLCFKKIIELSNIFIIL